MKRTYFVILLFFLLIIIGCGGDKTLDPSTPTKDAEWKTTKNKIAVVNSDGNHEWIQVFNPDGSVFGKIVGNFGITEMAWTPDGRVVFRDYSDNKFYLANADGSKLQPITIRYPSTNGGIHISPDGMQIAYRAWNSIVVSDLEGTSIREIAKIPQERLANQWYENVFSWSPDGSKLLFIISTSIAYQDTVKTVDIATGKQSVVVVTGKTPRYGILKSARFLDDTRILVCQQRINSSEQYRMWFLVVDHNGSNPVNILGQVDMWIHGFEPSPDGRYIMYWQQKGGLISVYIARSNGTNARLLVDNVYYVSWSPDGNNVAVLKQGVLETIRFDGTDQKQLATFENSPSYVNWSSRSTWQ